MHFIDENYHLKKVDEEVDLSFHFFEYDVVDRDFYLSSKNFWYRTEPVHWFTLSIGNDTVSLPGHMFIMVGDFYSDDVDWIKVEDIGNHEMTTLVYCSDLNPNVRSVEEVKVYYVEEIPRTAILPYTKRVLPVGFGKDRMLLISETDIYLKTRGNDFKCLF